MMPRPVTLLALAALTACAPPLPREDLTIASGEVALAGTLVGGSSPGRRPALLLLHGSGPDGRENPYYGILAEAFARRGFVVLIYDKRGSGQSAGDWRSVPFGALVDDAVAAMRTLRVHPTVDSTRVGIWGGSEGAGIAPEVADRVPGTAFLILQSMSGVTFGEQYLHQAAHEFRGNPDDSAAVLRLQRLKIEYARAGTGWTEYEAAVRAAAGQPYAPYASPATSDNWWWAWYRTKMDYSPGPALEQIRIPVLAVWGGADPLIPVAESRAAVLAARREAGVAGDSLLVIEGASHTLHIGGIRGLLAGAGLRNRPVHLSLMTRWAARQVSWD